MDIKTQVIVAVLIIIALGNIINMIKKKALELRYALAWLTVGVGVLILDFFPSTIERLASVMGIETPINMLFFLGFCFSLGIIFVLTVAISRISVRIKKMAQELARYERRMQDNEKE